MKPENKSGKRESENSETGTLGARSLSVFRFLFPLFRFSAFRFCL
jgi:hypothetical protein